MRRETRPKEIVIKPVEGERIVRCPDCGLPVGRVVGDEFHFFVHHHGERHKLFVNLRRGSEVR
jgi:uncharacterized C2H2 Zn-finger protein